MIGRAEVQVGTWRPGPDALEGGSGTQRFAEELDLPGRACVDGEIRESEKIFRGKFKSVFTISPY